VTKTEVCNLRIVFPIKKDVFWLEIAMRNVSGMDVIHNINDLPECPQPILFIHRPLLRHMVIQLAREQYSIIKKISTG
jgi:hypothetical protein